MKNEWQPKVEITPGPTSGAGYDWRTQPVAPTPTLSAPMTAIATYGGYTMPDYDGMSWYGHGDPFRPPRQMDLPVQPKLEPSGTANSVNLPTEPARAVTPQEPEPKHGHIEFGLPPSVKNAVRMIQPFYSENATVEKARSFWNSFERATNGLSDSVRLSAFRVLLKRKTGEDWWMYSRIEDFATLRTRFYNQFICQTPLQMIERLKNAKRSKGMSVEVWADVISNLCDAAQVVNPQMRYQYFLAGLRNSEWKTAPQTTMVNDIPRAVTTLLYKNMHLPTEDEAEFAGEVTKKPNSEESMMQQMLGLMQQTQNLLVTQNQLMARPPRSTRNRVNDSQPPFIAATYEDQTPNISAVAENAPNASAYVDAVTF
ncbi:hypothetical protein PHMEG_00038757 [Phytophthora megakarya]|uniref:Retrotransposon gag domain-containing protein n=1 Tax=Phytophthora megakarya TaxID=4795 RepID=A0A225UH86_9STRA|nr:hypothetical protein PHMEG_00038757 [Phytophthora megakarya]